MRRRVWILPAAVALALLLAVPASASKPTDLWFTSIWDFVERNCQERQVGDRCFVSLDMLGTFEGDITGNWAGTYSVLAKGPCETDYPGCGPGPFAYSETIKMTLVVTDAELLGKSGDFTLSCQGKTRQDPPLRLETYECVIQSGTGQLANMHGVAKFDPADGEWWAQVHFDSDK